MTAVKCVQRQQRAIAYVDDVGQVVLLCGRWVVDQEVRQAIVDRGVVVDELPAKRGGHQPPRHGAAAGCDVAEVDGQRRGDGRRAHLGADDLERDDQARGVLDDLRLAGGDAHVAGRTVSGVVDQEPQRERHGRFDLGGKRVVAVDLVFQEVLHEQLRVRPDFDAHRVQRHGDLRSPAEVGERAADEVLDRLGPGNGLVGGQDEPLGRRGREQVDDARSGHIGDVG